MVTSKQLSQAKIDRAQRVVDGRMTGVYQRFVAHGAQHGTAAAIDLLIGELRGEKVTTFEAVVVGMLLGSDAPSGDHFKALANAIVGKAVAIEATRNAKTYAWSSLDGGAWCISGRDCAITLSPLGTADPYGNFVATIARRGDMALELHPGWPKYFCLLDCAMQECEAWLRLNHQWSG